MFNGDASFQYAVSPMCFTRADRLLGGPKAMPDISQPADFVDVSQSPAVQRPSILGGHTPDSTSQKDAAHTPPELGGSVGCHVLSTSGSEGVGDDDLDLEVCFSKEMDGMQSSSDSSSSCGSDDYLAGDVGGNGLGAQRLRINEWVDLDTTGHDSNQHEDTC
ncbi:unnamed protein product, partial [Ectocarpus sp. 13 AM-2016]